MLKGVLDLVLCIMPPQLRGPAFLVPQIPSSGAQSPGESKRYSTGPPICLTNDTFARYRPVWSDIESWSFTWWVQYCSGFESRLLCSAPCSGLGCRTCPALSSLRLNRNLHECDNVWILPLSTSIRPRRSFHHQSIAPDMPCTN